MNRILALFVTTLSVFVGCDGLPAPTQYDHAMLREYFGKSPAEVEAAFGKPSSVVQSDSQSLPKHAAAKEQDEFKQVTESMTCTYSTPDGDLVFRFNMNDHVNAIIYAGETVSSPVASGGE